MDDKEIQHICLGVAELPELAEYITNMQAEIDMLNDFAKEVLLSILFPEHVRFFFDDDYYGRASEAMDALSKHMHDYRRILKFLQVNGIDINKILSQTESKELN